MSETFTKSELTQLVEGAQRFLAPESDPRDDELFDPSRPETQAKLDLSPQDQSDVVEARPQRHY